MLMSFHFETLLYIETGPRLNLNRLSLNHIYTTHQLVRVLNNWLRLTLVQTHTATHTQIQTEMTYLIFNSIDTRMWNFVARSSHTGKRLFILLLLNLNILLL